MALFDEAKLKRLFEYANVRYITYTFASGGVEYNIPHGLKRNPRKWIVAKISADATIYGDDDEEYLNLTASAPCTVTLEVN